MDQYLIYFLLYLFQLSTISFLLAQPLCHKDERLALLQFKEGFIIDKINASSDRCVFPKVDQWKFQGVDCCSWEGIECDHNTGYVISLNLSKSCLHGSINSRSSLFRLVHLEKLNLAYNNFSYSEIPSALGNLTRLTYLNLSYSLFSGQIPFAISKLSKLSTLDLSLNFAGVNPSEGLLELRRPDMKSLVQNLTSLTYLDLSLVDVSSPIPSVLANLSSLTSFSCHNCRLFGKFPEPVFNLPNLELLEVSKNYDLSGYLPEFHFSSRLKVLSTWMTNFSGEVPATIGNLHSLEYLGLSHCKFVGLVPPSFGNLTKITHLGFENNSFRGDVPSFLSNFTNLKFLALGHNQFHASEIPSSLQKLIHLERLDLAQSSFCGCFPIWLTNFTQLRFLDLGLNELQCQLPSSISRLKNLQYLDMNSNNLSGVVELNTFLELRDLEFLRLSNNKLSLLSKTSANASLPKLVKLRLASCNLTSFPDFLRNQEELQILDLSFNNIHGQIPKWLWEMSKKTLLLINLSHNSLTSFEEPPLVLPWTNLIRLNMGDNLLQGSLPIPSLSTVVYLVSNNSFRGGISRLFCSVTSLQVLDVSYNNLSGMIPQCLANFSKSLAILNLYSNNFNGPIPRTWTSGNNLQLINLGRNKFYGQVSRSLTRCSMLQYLDLGDNQFKDTFPSWLGVLQKLKVLILRSNGFHGTIGAPKSNSVFPKLHIIDLSNNEFTGNLPSEYLKTWNAMRNLSANSLTYMHSTGIVFAVEYNYKYRSVYNYSMTLTNKGVNLEFTQVSEVLIVIDLSSNRFQGEIPDSIGNLEGLQELNLSNNLLVGQIPQVIGSLSHLEALDLSGNKLVGRIPWQLRQLNFLAVFNVSHNNLTGPIPQGGQFNTFDNSSFYGNLELCGNSLSKKCEDSETSSSPSSSTSEENEDLVPFFHFGWRAVLMGYGFGMVIGVIIGHITVTRKHDWFIKVFGKKQWRRPIKSLVSW
ncbi:hypothetical protein REPUB_Repub05bG0079300 [Reevesia pubescens]